MGNYRCTKLQFVVYMISFLLYTSGIASAQSPVLYNASFETLDFLEDDVLEHAGWRTAESRKLGIVEGRYGKALHLGSVPEPFDLGNASSLGMCMYNVLLRMRNYRGPNWCGPFIWAGNKINPLNGSISFWIHGKLTPQWKLFYQTTTSFGRVERDLIVVRLDREGCLSGYLIDARYDRHEITSQEPVTGGDWKHIVFTWDMTSGLALYLNGKQVASNRGKDAWWMALAPGIFHLPSGGCTYDELYIMDRPLTEEEVRTLYSANTPPHATSELVKDVSGTGERLEEKSGITTALNLPIIEPSNGKRTLIFEELWTDCVADGHVPGWWVNDGRYVLAWPHPYAFWTITIGDMDFHAEKVDIHIPTGKTLNYITLEGNLEGVKVHTLEDESGVHTKTLLDVPAGHGFFFGSIVGSTSGRILRISFVKEWGTPHHYKGDLNLPLTGATRIHEVGLFNVSRGEQRPGNLLYLANEDPGLDTYRYGSALKYLTSMRDRTRVFAQKKKPDGKGQFIDTGAFKRIHIFSSPWPENGGVASINLNLFVRTSEEADVLLVRLMDPAVPSRIWTHTEVKLNGFHRSEPGLLNLTIDMTDIVLAAGDRLWLDICSVKGTEILVGDKVKPSKISFEPIPVEKALIEYTPKEIYAAQTEYSASNEYPLWVGKIEADYLKPLAWSGIFDKVYPVQAVRRVDPQNVMTQYLWNYASSNYRYMQRTEHVVYDYKKIDIPNGVPLWAAYFQAYVRLRNDIGNWWADHQNPDGQFGGGWNDDTTHLVFGMIDLPLDGNRKVLDAINLCRKGFDKTLMFKDGYMQLYPMDRHHTRDPVRAFHNVVLVNLGKAHQMEQAMEIGWHDGHPERTPIHYSENIPFEASATVVKWYWGLDTLSEPYRGPDEKTITENLKHWYEYFDSTLIWYATSSYKELGGYLVTGAYEFHEYFLGGTTRQRYPHIDFSVSWPKGGGQDVARWVEYADNRILKARIFSLDNRERNLTVRFYRLNKGNYSVIVAPDLNNDGQPDDTSSEKFIALQRFSQIDITIPPRVPLIFHVTQIEDYGDPGPLPDLVVDPEDIRVSNTFITVTVHNIGNAPARDIKVALLAGGMTIETKIADFIDAPVDYVPKYYALQFDYKSKGEKIEVIIDPDNSIAEVMEINNRTTAEDYRTDGYFDWSDIPFVP